MWKWVGSIIAALLAGWIGWASLTVSEATPRKTFDKHCSESERKFNRIQERVEDKLDKIQETILDLHKK